MDRGVELGESRLAGGFHKRRTQSVGKGTYHKSLVKVRSYQTFLPVVSDRASHSFWQRLLDAERDSRSVIDEFWQLVDAFAARGWET